LNAEGSEQARDGTATSPATADWQNIDTNGLNGSATAAAANDWVGIYDNSLTIPSPYYFTWSNILYDSY
jgi:hypothetical protein